MSLSRAPCPAAPSGDWSRQTIAETTAARSRQFPDERLNARGRLVQQGPVAGREDARRYFLEPGQSLQILLHVAAARASTGGAAAGVVAGEQHGPLAQEEAKMVGGMARGVDDVQVQGAHGDGLAAEKRLVDVQAVALAQGFQGRGVGPDGAAEPLPQR